MSVIVGYSEYLLLQTILFQDPISLLDSIVYCKHKVK